MHSLHIAHVVGFYVPGLGYEENCLPVEQARQGHNVCIVTSRRSPFPPHFTVSTVPSGGQSRTEQTSGGDPPVELHRLPSTPSLHGQVVLLGLWRTLKRLRPDIVHAHGALAPNSIQCLLFANSIGYSLFIDDHSHELNLHADHGVRAEYVRLLAVLYRNFERSVCAFLPIHSSSTNILHERLGVPLGELVPHELGADHHLFAPSATQRQNRRQLLGLSNQDLMLISTGKFTRDKDLDTLIRAVSLLPSYGDRVIVLLAGHIERESKEEIEELAGRLGVTNRLRFQPFVPHGDLPGYYNAADIGVWPGAPSITVLEALATGLSCVLPLDEPAYRTIHDRGAALGFRRRDPASLADSINKLLSNAAYRLEISKSCRRLIEEKLSWQAVCTRTLAVYDQLSHEKGLVA